MTSGPLLCAVFAVLVSAIAASVTPHTLDTDVNSDVGAKNAVYKIVRTAESLLTMQSDASRRPIVVLFVRSAENDDGAHRPLQIFDAAARAAQLDTSIEAVQFVVAQVGIGAAEEKAWGLFFSQLGGDTAAIPKLALRYYVGRQMKASFEHELSKWGVYGWIMAHAHPLTVCSDAACARDFIANHPVAIVACIDATGYSEDALRRSRRVFSDFAKGQGTLPFAALHSSSACDATGVAPRTFTAFIRRYSTGKVMHHPLTIIKDPKLGMAANERAEKILKLIINHEDFPSDSPSHSYTHAVTVSELHTDRHKLTPAGEKVAYGIAKDYLFDTQAALSQAPLTLWIFYNDKAPGAKGACLREMAHSNSLLGTLFPYVVPFKMRIWVQALNHHTSPTILHRCLGLSERDYKGRETVVMATNIKDWSCIAEETRGGTLWNDWALHRKHDDDFYHMIHHVHQQDVISIHRNNMPAAAGRIDTWRMSDQSWFAADRENDAGADECSALPERALQFITQLHDGTDLVRHNASGTNRPHRAVEQALATKAVRTLTSAQIDREVFDTTDDVFILTYSIASFVNGFESSHVDGMSGHGGAPMRHEAKGMPWYDEFGSIIHTYEKWALQLQSSLKDSNTVRFYTLDVEANTLPHALTSRVSPRTLSKLYRGGKDVVNLVGEMMMLWYVSGGTGLNAETDPGFVVPFPMISVLMAASNDAFISQLLLTYGDKNDYGNGTSLPSAPRRPLDSNATCCCMLCEDTSQSKPAPPQRAMTVDDVVGASETNSAAPAASSPTPPPLAAAGVAEDFGDIDFDEL